MSKASMARAVIRAGKKQKAQTRGLTGKRNQQGDFIPEHGSKELSQMTSNVADNNAQSLLNNAKNQLDDLDARIVETEKWLDNNKDSQEWDLVNRELNELEMSKQEVLLELESSLEELGVKVPQEVKSMIDPEVRRYYEDGGNPELANDMANADWY